MPTPGVNANLAERVASIYEQAERRLIELMAAKVKQGLAAPDWAEKQLHTIQQYRRQAERIAATAAQQAAKTAGEAVTTVFNRGNIEAVAELAELLRVPLSDTVGVVDTQAVAELAAETERLVRAPAQGMVNTTTSALQQVTAQALAPTITDAETRLQAAQTALNRFAEQGITGFTDRAGRRWRIDSYVEMATRTQLTEARIQGHTNRLQAHGMDLVIVSDSPQECRLCRPFEGKVLSISGATVGAITTPDLLTDEPVQVDVMMSLADAKAQGLFHPSCTHSYSAYQPGVTKPPTDTANPAGDEARQQLRYLERGVRRWKRVEAAALDPAAAKAARAKAREWQARIREHVATTEAKRQPQRERLTAR